MEMTVYIGPYFKTVSAARIVEVPYMGCPSESCLDRLVTKFCRKCGSEAIPKTTPVREYLDLTKAVPLQCHPQIVDLTKIHSRSGPRRATRLLLVGTQLERPYVTYDTVYSDDLFEREMPPREDREGAIAAFNEDLAEVRKALQAAYESVETAWGLVFFPVYS